jgi:hypothetical protein
MWVQMSKKLLVDEIKFYDTQNGFQNPVPQVGLEATFQLST